MPRVKRHFSAPSFPSAAAATAAATAAAGLAATTANGDGTPPTPFLYGAIAPVILGVEMEEGDDGEGGQEEEEEEEEKRRRAALYRLRQQQQLQLQWVRGPEEELTYAQVCVDA
jgi:hypothetical protein